MSEGLERKTFADLSRFPPDSDVGGDARGGILLVSPSSSRFSKSTGVGGFWVVLVVVLVVVVVVEVVLVVLGAELVDVVTGRT